MIGVFIPIEQDDPRDGIWTSTDDLLSLLQADFDRQLTDLGVPLAAQAALWSAVVNHEAVDIEGIVSQMTDSATPVSHEALLARFQGGAYDLIFSLDGTSGVGQQITQDLNAHGVTYDELIAFGSLYRQMAQAGSEEELLAGKALLGQLETATAQIPEQVAGMSLASIRLAAAAFNRSYARRLSGIEALWLAWNSLDALQKLLWLTLLGLALWRALSSDEERTRLALEIQRTIEHAQQLLDTLLFAKKRDIDQFDRWAREAFERLVREGRFRQNDTETRRRVHDEFSDWLHQRKEAGAGSEGNRDFTDREFDELVDEFLNERYPESDDDTQAEMDEDE